MGRSLLNKPSNNQSSYPKRDGDEYYLKTDKNKTVFIIRGGEPAYAKDKHKNDIYPEEGGEQVFIETSKGPVYARNAAKREIYPKDKNKNDKPIFTKFGVQYVKDNDGNEYYPKNADGSEQKHGRYALNYNGLMKYPLDKHKRPHYPIDPNTGNEMYHFDQIHKKLIIGKDSYGNQVYAKDSNGNEFYPGKGMYAKTHDGFPIYAVTATKDVIFPKDSEGNESYLKDERDNDIYKSAGLDLPRYARDRKSNEIYPIHEVLSVYGTYQEICLGVYAKRKNNSYYPLDAYGNEYIIRLTKRTGEFDEKASLPVSYPITNDNWVIVPMVDNKPYILNFQAPHLTEKNLIGNLFRDRWGYSDFLSDVISIRTSRSPIKQYKFLPKGSVGNPVTRNADIHRRNQPPANALNPPNLSESSKKERNWLSIILIVCSFILGLILLNHFKTSATNIT